MPDFRIIFLISNYRDNNPTEWRLTLGHIGTNDIVTDVALSQSTNLIHGGNVNTLKKVKMQKVNGHV